MVKSRKISKRDVVNIMKRKPDEDGPYPMKHFRPSEKRPNAAEQFRTENQGPVKTLRSQSDNGIRNVDEHCLAYPRLEAELHKKKSLLEITMIKAKDLNTGFDLNCRACLQLATYNDLKKKSPRPRCRKYAKRQAPARPKSRQLHRPIKNLTGVNKPKARKNRQTEGSKLQIYENQCPDSYTIIRKVSKSCGPTTYCNTATFKAPIKHESINGLHGKVSKNDEENLTDDDKQKQRPKKHPSVSSYNSFWSIDHEPMDL